MTGLDTHPACMRSWKQIQGLTHGPADCGLSPYQ
ncbi:hypothetical protein LuPra_03765 [Luteitalea pratensis]|uniref:Uncharacterized protein n=1 Tax=Luteitalea pratensis TaxID=1855912 RepID=A0A143PRS6_LUTPR|nr:hypothetical protein LuPra_03765 [Luteitalea pratensis]